MGKGAQKGDFIGGEPTNSNTRQAGKVVPTVAAHPVNFLMPQDDTRHQEKPGEANSHGCRIWEATQSSWDPGVSPRFLPITDIGYFPY